MGDSSRVPIPFPSVKSSLEGTTPEGRRSYTDLFNSARVRSQDGRGGNWSQADARNFKPSTHPNKVDAPSSDKRSAVLNTKPVPSKGATLDTGGLPMGTTNDLPIPWKK